MSFTALNLDEGEVALGDDVLSALRQAFYGPILMPCDPEYDTVRQIWNGAMYDRRPALILRCTGAADVIDAVNFVREHRLLATVRGGGHHVAGKAALDNAVMIDLSLMKGIQVDLKNCTARAQAGVTWGELDRETQAFGLATPGGVVSTTGIAGLTLGGGMGWLRRKYGLACDNLLSVDIVTADGQFLHADANDHQDLFWAVRGGGGNFGIVTAFEYRLYPVGPIVMNCTVFYPMAEAKRVLTAWRDFMAAAPDEVSSIAFFWAIPSVQPIPAELWAQPTLAIGAVYAGDAAEGERLLQPLRTIATPLLDLSGQMPYRMVQAGNDPFFPKAGHLYYNKSTDLTSLDDIVLDAILDRVLNAPTPIPLMVLWDYSGAVSRVPMDATAFSGRKARCLYSVDAVWDDPADSDRIIAWARDFIKALQPFSAGGHYVNFASDNESPNSAYGANYQRLVQIKTKYDPANLFRVNANIKPA